MGRSGTHRARGLQGKRASLQRSAPTTRAPWWRTCSGSWSRHLSSGTKKEHKPKLLSPDIFRWGRGLPREGVGAKKFGMSLETREIKLFWQDIPGFCRDIPGVPEKFEKEKFGRGCPKSWRKKSLGSIFVPY